MRDWGVFLFFASFFFLYCVGSLYIAWRVNAAFKTVPPYRTYIYCSMVLMTAVSTIAYICSTYNIKIFLSFFGPLGAIWMGVIGITATVLLANDIVNLGNLIFKIKNFRYYSTAVSLAVAVVLCVFALANTAFVLKVKKINLKVPGLQADKLNVVMITDVHITAFTTYKSINRIVDEVNSLNPDIILIGGDLLDTDISENYASYGLDRLKAKYGIFAVTGNHEYYTGIGSYERLLESMNVKLLRNENVYIEGIITVAGINDKQGHKDGTDTADILKAFEGIDKNSPVLFLSHRPEPFDEASEKVYTVIQFSGHTHGGQTVPLSVIRRLFKYNYGEFKNKDSYMYLSSGTRWWGPPMRLFTNSEIVQINMEKQ